MGRLERNLQKSSADLIARIDRLLAAKKSRLEAATILLQERSPYQLLERGYAIVYDSSGKVLRAPDQVSPGDEIAVRLARGSIDATVRRKRNSRT
jgi:exodeoxyribonuclease VII large subunit